MDVDRSVECWSETLTFGQALFVKKFVSDTCNGGGLGVEYW
jgi:hypothetical protein